MHRMVLGRYLLSQLSAINERNNCNYCTRTRSADEAILKSFLLLYCPVQLAYPGSGVSNTGSLPPCCCFRNAKRPSTRCSAFERPPARCLLLLVPGLLLLLLLVTPLLWAGLELSFPSYSSSEVNSSINSRICCVLSGFGAILVLLGQQ